MKRTAKVIRRCGMEGKRLEICKLEILWHKLFYTAVASPGVNGILTGMEKPSETPMLLRRPWLIALLLGAVTLAIFSSAIGFDFLNYDDNAYVYENPAVLHGISGDGLVYALTTGDNATWAPVTWLSFELDSTVLGTRPSSYHTTNVILHVAAGMFLFFALSRVLKSLWAATLITGIFLLHPLRTESVAWIAERKDVLFGLFWAAGLLAYSRYVEKPGPARSVLVLVCFVLGAMSKMMMVTFPFVLLLLDIWPFNRVTLDLPGLRTKAWPLIREKIPLFVLMGLVVFLNSRALNKTQTLDELGTNISSRLLRVPENYLFYVEKFFWPANRSIIYANEKIHTGVVISGVLLLLAVSLFTVWKARKQPGLLVGWLWFVGTLVPVIGFITFGSFYVADRYSYIPSIGLSLALVVGLEPLVRRTPRFQWAIALIIMVACAVGTSADLPRWKNSLTLYDAALAVGPHHLVYNNRGAALLQMGKPAEALEDFDAAIKMKPDYADAYGNRGMALLGLGKLDEAIEACDRALALDAKSVVAYNCRGAVFLKKGDTEHAMMDFNAAIMMNPRYATALSNRASIYLDQGNVDAAIQDCDKAIYWDPKYPDAWLNRGNAYSRLGNVKQALDDYDQAIDLKPDDAMYYNNRAGAYFSLQQYAEAKADLDKCRELGGTPHPGLVQALEQAMRQGK